MGSQQTRTMKLLLVIALSTLALTTAQSVKSCGKPTDILQNATFTSNPDPNKKGSPLTITATGHMTAPFTGATLAADLNIKALGIINEPVKGSVPLTVSPGLPAGDVKFVIGPFSPPSIPGSLDITGTVTATDAQGKEIFCVALDMNVFNAEPMPTPEASMAILTRVGTDPVADCGKDSDHLKNRTFSDSGGVITATGDLDETIASGAALVDLKVKVSFFTIPININVPFSLSPVVPSGPFKLTAGPSTTFRMVNSPDIKVEVTGTVKVNDAKSEEVICLALDVQP